MSTIVAGMVPLNWFPFKLGTVKAASALGSIPVKLVRATEKVVRAAKAWGIAAGMAPVN